MNAMALRVFFSIVCSFACAIPIGAQTMPDTNPSPLPLVATDHVWGSPGTITGRDQHVYLTAYAASFGAKVGNSGRTDYTVGDFARLALSKHAGLLIIGEPIDGKVPVRTYSLGSVAAVVYGWTPVDPATDVRLGTGESIVVTTPPRALIPIELRAALADYLREADHVENPKLGRISITDANGVVRLTPIVVPNLPRSGFASDAVWMAELHRLQWFLPPTVIAVRPPVSPDAFNAWFRTVDPLVEP